MTYEARIIQLAVQLLERTAGCRRTCRRCRSVIVENAGKVGTAWSVCAPCEARISQLARQLDIEPPLIPGCLVCGTDLVGRRKGTRTCGSACRTLLSRVLQHRYR